MSINNFYQGISRFSLSNIIQKYLFDIKPDRIQLSDKSFLIYPLGLQSGLTFYHHICSNVFDNIQIRYFKAPTSTSARELFLNFPFLDNFFRLLDQIYNLDDSNSLYSLLQKSNMKQIRYLLYIIKRQNFTQNDRFTANHDTYNQIANTIDNLDRILKDYKHKQSELDSKKHTLEVDAIEYSIMDGDMLNLDYTTQFFKDYIVGNESFYAVLSNSYLNKFINLTSRTTAFLSNDDPIYWCKYNNNECIQSCKIFDPGCSKRYLKQFTYFPFRSIYVLPQILSLLRYQEKENELDVFIRSILYSLRVSFGERDANLSNYAKVNYNQAIDSLVDKNRVLLIESLFNNFDFKEIENSIRTAVGLEERKLTSFESTYDILVKIYKFIDVNKTFFLNNDETRIVVFDEFLHNINDLLFEKKSDDTNLNIYSDDDFTSAVLSLTDSVEYIDNMLMTFPNDMKSMNSLVSSLLKAIQQSKKDMAKLAGGKAPIDPREALLISESILFKRIAVDDSLWLFYKENNKTKLVNSILFWKWVIAFSFFAEMVLKLDENHAIQKMTFNENL